MNSKKIKIIFLILISIYMLFTGKTYAKYAINYEQPVARIFIDVTPPEISGVENGSWYNTQKTVKITDNIEIKEAKCYWDTVSTSAFNNVLTLSESTFYSDGYYKIIAIDTSDNISECSFAIDTTQPNIEGVENGECYEEDVEITYLDNMCIKSATYTKDTSIEIVEFASGTKFTESGIYYLTITDFAENITTCTFEIKKKPLEVNRINYRKYNY